MKAVNLLPVEARPATGLSLRGLGAGTIALLSGLAMALVVVALFVVLSNQVADKRAERDRLTAQAAATEGLAAKLKPYVEALKLREQTEQQVRTLAKQRYDWPQTLGAVARVLPSDVALTDLDGEPGTATSGSATPATSSATSSTSASSATGTSAPAGPTIKLQGCTVSHIETGRTMQLLRQVPGVVDVTLQSSTLSGAQGAAAAGAGASCPYPDQFQMTVQLAAAPSAAPASSSSAPSGTASAPSTPATPSTPAATATPGGTR